MQKHSELRRRTGVIIPMLVLLALGLLFFGVYILASHKAGAWLTTQNALIFLGAYAAFSLLACLFFLLREHKERSEENLYETLNTKMHNMFKYAVGLPYAITDEQGRVRVLNSALQSILGAEDPFWHGMLSEFCGGTSLQEIIRAGIGGEDRRTDLGRLTMHTIAIQAESTAAPAETLPASSIDGTVVTLPDEGRYVARAYALTLNDTPSRGPRG